MFIIVVISVWAKQKQVHIGSIVLVPVHCTGSTSDFSNHWTSGLSWRRQIPRVSPCICQSCCLFLWWSEWHSWQPNHIFCAWVAYVTCGIRYASYERKRFFFICKDLQDMSAIFLLWQCASVKPFHLLFIPLHRLKSCCLLLHISSSTSNHIYCILTLKNCVENFFGFSSASSACMLSACHYSVQFLNLCLTLETYVPHLLQPPIPCPVRSSYHSIELCPYESLEQISMSRPCTRNLIKSQLLLQIN